MDLALTGREAAGGTRDRRSLAGHFFRPAFFGSDVGVFHAVGGRDAGLRRDFLILIWPGAGESPTRTRKISFRPSFGIFRCDIVIPDYASRSAKSKVWDL